MMTIQDRFKYEKLLTISEPFEALLFDVDGTLANNIQAHKAAYVQTAHEYGITLDDNLIDETAGWPTIAVAQEIVKRYKKSFDVNQFSKRKSAIFIEHFIQSTEAIPFVKQVLLDHVGIKRIGIVSGGSRSTLNITLDVIGVKGCYETMVCAGDTTNGKPSPEPFLLAANKLQVAPEKCLVFEDGTPGVQGAIAAGMSWVRIDQL